ncbi:hypothetical protein JW935_19145 [candidate division KSB1 bacterium]|nr:hypothetical protein [candidate division KSB1 bacterium]
MYEKPLFVSVLPAGIFLIIACWAGIFYLPPVYAQQVSATYSMSTPEAGLFFLNPGYINPALGRGVLGLASNPASIGHVYGREIALAGGLPRTSTGKFSIQATDSTQLYTPVVLTSEMRMRELGGLLGIGYAQQVGPWRFGAVLYQPRSAGFSLHAGGSTAVSTHFQVDQPITRQHVPDLPVEEIPVKWNIASRLDVAVDALPAEVRIGYLPFTLGASYTRGVLAVGAGISYYHIYSSGEPATFNSSISGRGSIIGRPYGNDPLTGLPWQGELTADFTLQDQPLTGYYLIDISGGRFALNFGGMVNWGLLSLGGAYSRGLKARVHGGYNMNTVYSTGLPSSTLEAVQIDLSLRPKLTGSVNIDLIEFEKDTVSYSKDGSFTLNGYQSYSFGLQFLILGLFAGGDIPVAPPDLASFYTGAYIDFPLPRTPVRLNTGFFYRTDGLWSEDKALIPFRVLAHVGMGAGIKMPWYQWIKIGDHPGWLRLGLRASLAGYSLETFEKNTSDTKDQSLPSIFDNLTLSLGFEVPL